MVIGATARGSFERWASREAGRLVLKLAIVAAIASCGPSEPEEGRIRVSQPELERGAYHASSLSKVFHVESCEWAAKISPGNLVTFRSRSEAGSKGFRPCQVCRP